MLIDRDGVIIAGNKTAEQALAAGMDVIVVQSDGTKLIAVQRTDLSLDDPKAQGLAIADNRTSELGLDWDADVLKELVPDLDLQPYFSTDELEVILGLKATPEDEPAATDQSGTLGSTYNVLVTCNDEASQLALLERLTGEGYECRSLIA